MGGLKNLEPFTLILDLDWRSDTRGTQNDKTISLTLQLFWAYGDPSSCSCVHPAFFVSSLQHTFFMYVLSVTSKMYVRCLIYLYPISLVIFFLSQHLCSNIKVFTCHNIERHLSLRIVYISGLFCQGLVDLETNELLYIEQVCAYRLLINKLNVHTIVCCG